MPAPLSRLPFLSTSASTNSSPGCTWWWRAAASQFWSVWTGATGEVSRVIAIFCLGTCSRLMELIWYIDIHWHMVTYCHNRNGGPIVCTGWFPFTQSKKCWHSHYKTPTSNANLDSFSQVMICFVEFYVQCGRDLSHIISSSWLALDTVPSSMLETMTDGEHKI